MAIRDFSDNDMTLLHEIVAAHKHRIQGSPRGQITTQDQQTPEVYLIRPPAEGIAALTRDSATGTGPEDNNDTPGKATCELWNILSNVMEPLTGGPPTAEVYNYSESVLSQDWTLGIKTKFGNWIAIPLTSGIASSCEAQNEIQIINIFGLPTGGTFDLVVTVDGTGTANSETMTFDFDFTSAEIETELETHADISSGDVDCTGGPLPNAAVKVEFIGDLANTDISIMMPDHTDLTGGSGVGVLISVDQHGTA